MEAPAGQESDPGYWKQCWESERQEFLRSERVQNQLQSVLQSLQQRCNELEAENDRFRAEVRPDATCERLEGEVLTAVQARQALEARHSALSLQIERYESECQASAAESAAQFEALAECEAAREGLEEAAREAEAKKQQAGAEARSMVMAEALHRAREESKEAKALLQSQEAETAQLRQALADSWAARADDFDGQTTATESTDPNAALKTLDGMEEELRWLAKMQQEAAAEVHHVQKLERTEAALQRKLREASEENAALRSARMDLGDAGRAMREAIAYQSERYVGRVDGLAEERKRTDTDREKLMQECADLQVRLDEMAPQLADLVGLEERHGELEEKRRALTTESERLHSVNAALGVQLLGDDAPPCIGADEGSGMQVAEAITKLLQLQRRLTDREASHAEEKQRLADRIRTLEREAATSGLEREKPPAEPSTAKAVAARPGNAAPNRGTKKVSASATLTSASSVLKGGFGRLREAAGV